MHTEEKWLEGFTGTLLDHGVPSEALPGCIKAAALLELTNNPDFAAGMQEKLAEAGIDKEAAPSLKVMLAMLPAIWQMGTWGKNIFHKIHRGISPHFAMADDYNRYNMHEQKMQNAKNRFDYEYEKEMGPYTRLHDQLHPKPPPAPKPAAAPIPKYNGDNPWLWD